MITADKGAIKRQLMIKYHLHLIKYESAINLAMVPINIHSLNVLVGGHGVDLTIHLQTMPIGMFTTASCLQRVCAHTASGQGFRVIDNLQI